MTDNVNHFHLKDKITGNEKEFLKGMISAYGCINRFLEASDNLQEIKSGMKGAKLSLELLYEDLYGEKNV